MSKAKKIIISTLKIIVSAACAIFVSIWVVSLTMRALEVFEMEMLPKLIVPIVIVAIPLFMLFYHSFFRRKKRSKHHLG